MRTEMGDLTGARRHLQRANLICQHHHAWFRANRAMYWLGRTQIQFSDPYGARRALLEAILPPSAYREFAKTGEAEARFHENVAIFYLDFADFTEIASGMPPRQLVEILGELFDGCERVETIGDAYLAVAGMAGSDDQHGSDRGESVGVSMVRATLEIRRFLAGRNAEFEALGSPSFEAGGVAGEVTISGCVADAITGAHGISVEQRDSIAAKGKGELVAFHAVSQA
ncbi:MAG: adenylate/guanylate cyclase domain-containing protein [Spirochaetota bacterium]